MAKRRVWLVQLPLVLVWTLAFLIAQRGDERTLTSAALRSRIYPTLRMMEGFSTDLKFRLRGRRPLGPKIVMVEIDEDAINQIGRWPWHRDAMAVLIQSAFDAGARVVGLDIVFSEPDVRVPDAVGELLRSQGLGDRIPTFETDLVSAADHRAAPRPPRARLDERRRLRACLGTVRSVARAAEGLRQVRLRQGERHVSSGLDGATDRAHHHRQPRRLRRRGGALRLLQRLARSRRRDATDLRRRDRQRAALPVAAAGDGARRPRRRAGCDPRWPWRARARRVGALGPPPAGLAARRPADQFSRTRVSRGRVSLGTGDAAHR